VVRRRRGHHAPVHFHRRNIDQLIVLRVGKGQRGNGFRELDNSPPGTFTIGIAGIPVTTPWLLARLVVHICSFWRAGSLRRFTVAVMLIMAGLTMFALHIWAVDEQRLLV